jgi:XTP/dITP diphosphohydrolase
MNMRKLLLASNNPGKLREIQALLGDLTVELILPSQIGLNLNVEENGPTYRENASTKALTFSLTSGLPSLADDSGLEVAALGGLPGLHSARFSPLPGATDADRRAQLLLKLQNSPPPWLAKFHCTVALATPDGQVYFSTGECAGEIIPEERGQEGFGYDPIFLIRELGKTMAELSMDEKNRLSHRARAIIAARPILAQILQDIQK